MSRTFAALTATAALLAGSAAADVTAADVWQNSNAIFGAMGGTLSATAKTSGATTIYGDYQIGFALPFGSGDVMVDLPDTALTENGDGTVTLTFPGGYDFGIAAEIYGEGRVDVQMAGDVGDTEFTASGTPGAVTYRSTGGFLTLSLASLNIDGEPFTDAEFNIGIQSTGAANEMTVTEGDLVTMVVQSSAESTGILWDYAVAGYETGMARNIVTNSTGGFEIAIPAGGVDIMNLTQAIRDGLRLSFHSTSETSNTTTVVKDSLGVITSEQSTQQGVTDILTGLDGTGFSLIGSVEGFAMSLREQFLPMVIAFGIEEIGVDWQIPLLASPEIQNLRLNTSITGIDVAPPVWGLIDPGTALDRSRMTVAIELAADAILDIDLLDIEALALLDQTGGLPGTTPNVTLNSFVAEAFGAVVTADGAMTLDFEQMAFLGAPLPAGILDFTATGVNGAIQSLTQTGLLSPTDAMHLTLMLGVVGRPVGNDAYEGTLELTEDGRLLANGMPLP